MYLSYKERYGSKQTCCAVRSNWLRVRGMDGTIRDMVQGYCTVISRNCGRGTEEEHEVPSLVESPAVIELGGS